MTYDYRAKKMVAVVASNLEVGVALNVVGHMAISMGFHSHDNLMGKNKLYDASGNPHTGIAKYALIITKVKPKRLKRFINEARQTQGITLIDYPEQMLYIEHDDDLAETISLMREEDINYLGAIIYGDSKVVEALSGKFTLWK